VFEASGLSTLTLIDVPAGMVTSRIFAADDEAVDSFALGCAAADDEAADFVSAAPLDSGVCGWPGGLVCEHATARLAAIVTSKIGLIISVLPPGGRPYHHRTRCREAGPELRLLRATRICEPGAP